MAANVDHAIEGLDAFGIAVPEGDPLVRAGSEVEGEGMPARATGRCEHLVAHDVNVEGLIGRAGQEVGRRGARRRIQRAEPTVRGDAVD